MGKNAQKKSWRKGWRLLLVLYIAVLAISHIWILLHPLKHLPEGNRKILKLQAVSGDSLLSKEIVNVSYIDEYHGKDKKPPVVLLLHGSPVALSMFSKLLPLLSTRFRVIAPAMPGYDASTRDVPDYSMRAYAIYTKQLIDSLGIKKINLVGYSLGSGIAVNFVHLYPSDVSSLDLLSGIGVQELDLLGSYSLNHAVYGVQLGLIWAAHQLLPHFGLLSESPLNIPYARSFYDSDQRPLRGYMKNIKMPVLIQQGERDNLVPPIVAEEHHRIIPQSNLILYNGGHNIIESKAKPIAKDLTSFLQSVEKKQAVSYAEASKTRHQASKEAFKNINFAKFHGISLAIIMFIIVIGTLISEDLTCVGAGLMAARGLISFWSAVFPCFIGILIGDMGLYLAGRWLGRPATNYAPFKWFISQSDLDRSSNWFDAKGPAIIFISRFLPGSRLPTYFSAGVIGAGFWRFSFYFLLACAVWTPLVVGITMLVGVQSISYFTAFKDYALGGLIGVILFFVFMIKIIIPLFSYRGRRLLVSRWRRLTQWEFWPPYILYFPVCLYVAYLWIKFKHLTIFTAANPGISDGGFIGESKSKILNSFQTAGCVASYRFLSCTEPDDDKYETALAFMREQHLDFPVVIKPDAGQRGAGVKIIRTKKGLKEAIKEAQYDLLIQKYIGGMEFGIFYYRYPYEQKGHIFSITRKKLLMVIGDGEKTIEELILDDERAVCMAKTHLNYHKSHLFDIPVKGKTVRLVEFGTHARGAVFEDGTELITPVLEQAIDRICVRAGGFNFGRFDVKTPTEDTLKRGEALNIIEVNGVTSEDTSIYDHGYTFIEAQKKLWKQWRIAFEIGTASVALGASYSSIKTLIKKIAQYKKK